MLDKMEKLGCRKSVVGLVIPTGYSFNLDGTSIYLTMAAVFIAQATNSQMDIVHQITLLIVLLLSSKGAAGVTGSGFIVLAATLSAVGHLPVAGLALINYKSFGKQQGQSYRFMYSRGFGETNTTLNITGYRYATRGYYDFDELQQIQSGFVDEKNINSYHQRSRISTTISQDRSIIIKVTTG